MREEDDGSSGTIVGSNVKGDGKSRRGIGRLTVEVREWDGSMVASELYSSYPMKLVVTSRPNNDGHNNDRKNGRVAEKKAMSCFVVGYGGGCVGGDVMELELTVKKGASLLITSQSTNKIFKCSSSSTRVEMISKASVQSRGLLVLVPQPMQCFAHSQTFQQTHVSLQDTSSSAVIVDWYTGGRCFSPNDESFWQFTSLCNLTTLTLDHTLILRDSTRLSSASANSTSTALQRHVRHYPILTTVFLIGPHVQSLAASLLQQYSHRTDNYLHSNHLQTNQHEILLSCGTFPTQHPHQEGVILRIAATSLETTALCLSKHIGTLNGQLESDPFLEILATKQSAVNHHHHQSNMNSMTTTTPKMKRQKNNPTPSYPFSLDLIQHSYTLSSISLSSVLPEDLSVNGFNKHHTEPIGQQKQHPYERMNGHEFSNGHDDSLLMTLFQLVDSCAPTGGFAHSNTVETAHQLGWISSSATLEQYVWDVILQTFTSQIPFVISTCQLFQFNNNNNYYFSTNGNEEEENSILKQFLEIDALLTANMTSHVARRASITQGSGMFRVFPHTFPQQLKPILSKLKKLILKTQPSNPLVCGHAATCWGSICGLLSISTHTSIYMFLYTTTRDMINAAVRMNIVGPMEGSYITNTLCQQIRHLLQSKLKSTPINNNNNNNHVYKELSLDSAHQVAPLIDLLSNAHDRLYTRLFNS